MSKQETIVLIPSWGMGHVIPLTQLAKLFTATGTTFSVAVVIFQPPYDVTSTIDPFVARVASAYPSISFHRLPPPSLPPNYLSDGRIPYSLDLLRFSNPQLADFLASLSHTSTVRALILDMFCSASLDVASDLRIPAYFFYASALFVLLSFISVPSIRSQISNNTTSSDNILSPIGLPGLPPIPTSCFPFRLFGPENELVKAFIFHCERYPKSDGILINTFEPMESRVVQAVKDGLHGPMPPVYCIGPLIADRSDEEEEEEEEEDKKHECLKWLDEQPKGSVLFLCFGSLGAFTVDQVKEVAEGLERSEQRFLWVVRSPVIPDSGEKRVGLGKSLEPDLEGLLPEGFVERVEGRGMVVKSWAPQKAVLGHVAVGGFVSHCGWNSILEAVSAGVAMIAWPLYAEQKMNKVFLVEEAKVAVEMAGYEVVVKAEEVEKKVRWLMESEGGKELKERMRGVKESAVRARSKGGPSDQAWMEFLEGLKERFV